MQDTLLPDRQLPTSETPINRLKRLGAAALSDIELLSIVLSSQTGRPEKSLEVAEQTLTYAGDLVGCSKFTGSENKHAARLAATFEIGRRFASNQGTTAPVLGDPKKIAEFMRPQTLSLSVEKFFVLSLNRRNRLIRCHEVTSGTAGSTLVHPREVFRQAIADSASAIVCVHNHPSGDPEPSAADVRVTRTLREAAQTVDIALLDHVIVGTTNADPMALGHYSFRDAGVL